MLHVTLTHSISALRGVNAGRRCVIVGNGPSLNKMDLSPLRDEWVIGTNYAFLKSEVTTPYICVSDTFRMEELVPYVGQLRDRIVFYNSHRHRKTSIWSIPSELEGQTVALQRIADRLDVSWDLQKGIYVNINMASVVFPAIQIALHMGASEIYLIGVDQDYSGPNLWFHGKSAIPHVNLPQANTMETIGHNFRYTYETHFKTAIIHYHSALAEKGVGLYNATVGGKLNDIPRVSFEEIFKK